MHMYIPALNQPYPGECLRSYIHMYNMYNHVYDVYHIQMYIPALNQPIQESALVDTCVFMSISSYSPECVCVNV